MHLSDWALQQFRDQYGDPSISKWDIFYYVYGLLHHPGYREKFADKLKLQETKDMPLSFRVEKMRLSKDKTAIKVNESLTLVGIPPEAFEYRLGNRSALDWVIDQYQVTTDKRSGITSDPNREDDER